MLQQRAKRFWSFLHRTLAPATIATYWAAVIAAHRDWLDGTSLRELGIVFPAIRDHISVFRLREPIKEQKENLWTLQQTVDVLDTSPDLMLWNRPTRSDDEFRQRSVFAVINTLWSQLLRASEILPSSSAAQARASTALWNLSDLSFHSTDGLEIPILPSGSPDPSRVHELAFAKMRMVPSKADKHATNLPLLFPMAHNSASRAMSPCAYFWDLCVLHPVCKAFHSSTPLFGSSMSSRGDRLSEHQFMKQWKLFCTIAGITFKLFGKHAFRRGGINRLIDLGCSAPQIAALGRWKSDVWKIYARRNKDQLMVITAAMAAPGSHSPLVPVTTAEPCTSLSFRRPGALRTQAMAATASIPFFGNGSLPVPTNRWSNEALPAAQPLAPVHSFIESGSNAPADALSRTTGKHALDITRSHDASALTVASLDSKDTRAINSSVTLGMPSTNRTFHYDSSSPPTKSNLSASLTARELRQLPSKVILINTPKLSSAPHINSRCEEAHGLSILQACALRVLDKDRALAKYSTTDIKYDLAKGFLRLHDSSVPGSLTCSTKRRRFR
jgi:hypothetical protein